jgi:hypothetical protein
MLKIDERISHKTFGEGIIFKIELDGPKSSVTVKFSKKVGLKKLNLKVATKYITRYSDYCFYDKDTFGWYNKDGFDESGYDKNGFNLKGVNKLGFNRNGIHQDTGTIINAFGYDIYGNNNDQLINKYTQIINQKITPLCEIRFDGFYHMTHILNAASIIKKGKLFSRSRKAMLYDMTNALSLTNSIIGKTDEAVQDHARFYFRYKTPTFWYFEDLKEVVLLKFSKKLLAIPNAKISAGSAGKASNEILSLNAKNLERIDFATVFLSSNAYKNEEEKNLRHSELLIPGEVALELLEKIIFRSNKDLMSFKQKFGHRKGITYITDKSKFFKEY